ncbi:MAG: TatD family hydrolase [Streptococcaceae bacterium]|jgi:TatD DNase family protein|nr:TatD family hydrolase [Streptococcaceae bacterium]
MLKIFDSHTHLNSTEFIGEEASIISKAHEQGVLKMNIVGCDLKTNKWALDLAAQYEGCYATIGWHPDECAAFDTEAEEFLLSHLADQEVLALGEIGLDYHWMVSPKELQEEIFRRQIRIAKRMNKPFMVHTRDALEDTYTVIREEGVGEAGAIMHSFSGSFEEATRFADLGMMISFSGVVTFKKAKDVQEAAAKLPLGKILVETDAPYLSPVPFRGKRNMPAYTRYTVEKIAELRGITTEEAAEATYQNALRVFKLE